VLGRARIAALIPHHGAMCLLDQVVRWNAREILCGSRTHLEPGNPLRRAGTLGMVCGIEYGLQAAALHGALRDGARQPPGYLAGLRDVTIEAGRLDDAALGTLEVAAMLELNDRSGMIYGFRLASETGRVLVEGRATIVLTP
jgi:predicted hotdog family 3-hydroxylacyl-ACP dehydratase